MTHGTHLCFEGQIIADAEYLRVAWGLFIGRSSYLGNRNSFHPWNSLHLRNSLRRRPQGLVMTSVLSTRSAVVHSPILLVDFCDTLGRFLTRVCLVTLDAHHTLDAALALNIQLFALVTTTNLLFNLDRPLGNSTLWNHLWLPHLMSLVQYGFLDCRWHLFTLGRTGG